MKRKLEYPVGGTRFGELRVITGEVVKVKVNNYMWCRCSCGVEELVAVRSLVRGMKTRCHNHHMQVRPGDKFGDWEVLEEVERGFHGRQRQFQCRCVCGTERVVSVQALLYGGSKHCASCRAKRHGHATNGKPTVEYRAWHSMRQRCNDPKIRGYKDYGGRGISYDPSWEVFENFYRDMGPKPSPEHTLERKDNEAHYTKENCIWALQKDQCNNRRSNRYIEYDGKRLTTTQWAAETGIRVRTLQYRLQRNWPLDKVFGRTFCHYQEGPAHQPKHRDLENPSSHGKKRKVVYERDGGKCRVCGEKVSFDVFHMGHAVDHAVGGGDGLDNLVLMCKPCNRTKPMHPTREAFEAWLEKETHG